MLLLYIYMGLTAVSTIAYLVLNIADGTYEKAYLITVGITKAPINVGHYTTIQVFGAAIGIALHVGTA